MIKITGLIFVALFVYGSCEISIYNKNESKNVNETDNSTQTVSNHLKDENNNDAFFPSIFEILTDFVTNFFFSETIKTNSSGNSDQTLKRKENLLSSDTEGVNAASFSVSTSLIPSLSPSLSSEPTSSKNIRKKKDLTSQEIPITEAEDATTKIYVVAETSVAVTKQTLPAMSTATTTMPNKQTDPKPALKRLKIREASQDLMNFAEGDTYLCTKTHCLNLTKNHKKISRPALCDIGRFGSGCSYQCKSCLGRLCETNGACLLGHVDSCDLQGCHRYSGQILNLQLKERPDFVAVEYDAPPKYKFNYGLKIIYWSYTNHIFSMDIATEDKLPLFYRTYYIVCVLFIPINSVYLRDVECQTLKVDARCIHLPVRFYSKSVSWLREKRSDLFQSKIYLSFKTGDCGSPAQNNQTYETKDKIFKYPEILRGIWEICVVGEKEIHDVNCSKKEDCKDRNFGQENLVVENIVIEEESSNLKISWTFPKSWTFNCGFFIFKIRIIRSSIVLSEFDEYSCQSERCFLNIINNLPNGLYIFEVTPIFDKTIEGARSISYKDIKKLPRMFEVFTPPDKPNFEEKIEVLSSDENNIILRFPSYEDQEEGKIYIVVAKGCASNLKPSYVEDYVKEFAFPIEFPTRIRRSTQKNDKPFNLFIVDVLSIKTKEYDLNAEKVFKENETRTEISVAAVFAPEAGEYRTYGSTEITRSIKFPPIEPKVDKSYSWVIWLMIILILVCVSVGLSIYLRRLKKST